MKKYKRVRGSRCGSIRGGGDLDVKVEEVGRDLDWEIELVEVI